MLQLNTDFKKAISQPAFDYIAQAAEALQLETYVIGGYVRDFLLEREKPKDIDIVAVGSGIDLANKVAELLPFNPKVQVFKTYGTAMLKFKDLEIEFVGARKESYVEHSRNPMVDRGSLKDDQNRRDFTINAMAISLNTADYGALVDPFDGITDLKNKVIRTPLDPDITFSDDPLRMMRAIRFSSQLGFEIEAKSLDSITRNATRIQIVSKERVVDELHKIMLSKKPSVGLKLLFQTGLLHFILPELADLQGVEQIKGQKHKDNFYHTLQVVDNG